VVDLQTIRNKHWAYTTLFYIRFIWIVLHLALLSYEFKGSKENLFFILFTCIIAGAVPQVVWYYNENKKPWLYPVVELVMSGLFFLYSSYVIDLYFSYLAIPAMCAAATIPSKRLRIPLWIWFSALPAIAMTIVLPVTDYNISIIEGFLFFGLGTIIWKVLDTQRKMQELLEENDKQRQVLEQYAKQVERITLLEERNRLSRELHDTVGHTLTSVIMGLDAVSFLIRDEPEEALQNVKQLSRISREGLEEVRRQIHHISPLKEDGPISNQLKSIAAEFSLSTGTEIKLDVNGTDVIVHPQVSLILIRCLQESLTNAKRHGKADCINILFNSEPHQLSLAIHDNGCGMDEVVFGFGLSSMRERIETFQGTLEIESIKGKGTTVVCQLPYKIGKAG